MSAKNKIKITSKNTLEPIRKSTRFLKKSYEEEEEDDEIQYLEKLKQCKTSIRNSVDSEFDHKETTSNRKNSTGNHRKRKPIYEADDDFDLLQGSKVKKNMPKSCKKSKNADHTEEEQEYEVGSDSKKKNTEFSMSIDDRKENSLTSRQRSLQFSKDGARGNQTSLIEFPDGLPSAPSRSKSLIFTNILNFFRET